MYSIFSCSKSKENVQLLDTGNLIKSAELLFNLVRSYSTYISYLYHVPMCIYKHLKDCLLSLPTHTGNNNIDFLNVSPVEKNE